MIKFSRLLPSIRPRYVDNLGRKFASSGESSSNRNKKAMLAALLSDSPLTGKSNSVRLVGEKLGNASEEAQNALQAPNETKPRLSFFDEVDVFLAKEQDKLLGASTKLTPHPTGSRTDKTGPSSPEWSSHLVNNGTKKKSIFDVFKVPDPVPERSESAFHIDAYNTYIEIVDEIYKSCESDDGDSLNAETKADVVKWLRADEPKVKAGLPLFSQICELGIESVEHEKLKEKTIKKMVRDEIEKQAITFQERLGWNKHQYTYATSMIDRTANLSSINHKALPVVVILEKMKEAGHVKKETLAHCLNAASSFSGGVLSRGRGILGSTFSGKNRLYDILEGKESRKEYPTAATENDIASVPEQLASANDLFYEPTHHSTTIRIRRFISLDNPEGALELIESNLVDEAKLRSYSQVFSLYLELGQITSAMKLFEKMKENHDILNVEPEMFIQLMAALAERGYFCHDAKLIRPDAPTSGPELFDHLVQEMSEYVSSISSASAKRLQKALKRGFREQGSSDSDLISALAPLKPLRGEKIQEDILIADRVTVEASTGFCVCSNTTLRLIGLEQHQKDEMKNSLIEMAKATDMGNRRGNHQKEALLAFWDWMNNRSGRPFTVLLDGANIAYYMQNFDKGKFNFHQIEFAVAALEGIGEHPLVILPRRYGNDVFNATVGQRKQRATKSEKSILKKLWTSEKLYLVPQGCLDDYFWLLASVSDQPICQAEDSEESLPSGKMLWQGNRPVVMTNDHVRDHQEFQFLRPRLFNRWYSSTIMNYNFTGFVGDECVDPEIAFTPADVYSREIQGNNATANGSIEASSRTWHFPVQDWDTTDWFCVRLPNTV